MHSTADSNSFPTPQELCGYRVERALTPDLSYLAIGPGGRKVVLKRVDEDCLLRNQLHPSIRDRLGRVRELAHGGVANLHGVERDGDAAWLVWEYVEGQTFDESVADPQRTPRDLMVLARELILAVDSLHLQGIVHGALVGGNVVVTPDGTVRLVHISPLLYTDMDVDADCVLALLEHAVEERGEQGSPFGQLLAEARRERTPLRALGTKLAAMLEVRPEPLQPQVRSEERHIRRRTLVAATLVAILGIVIAYAIWRAIDVSGDFRNSLHWGQETNQGQ
jgi:tRNA A-37 threonylcarbamoyl transferase component Bud32